MNSWCVSHLWDELPVCAAPGSQVGSSGQTGAVCGAELELGSVPVGQHRALPLQGSLWGVLCGCRSRARCLGNCSGERFLPEANVRTPSGTGRPMALCSLHFCSSQIHPWLRGSVAGAVGPGQRSHCWIPGVILALELENKKGFGWPLVGLRLLWLRPLRSSPWWLWGVCPKPSSSWKCFLWFLWPLAADMGDFHPQDVAAPWDTARGCRKLLLRLVLPWNVGTALGLSLSWVIPGNPAAPALPVELRDGDSLHCPQLPGQPLGSQSCPQYLSLLLGCVPCLNIPGEGHLGIPDGCTAGILWAEPVDPEGLPTLRSMFISMFAPLKPVLVTGNVCGPGCVSRVFPAPAWGTGSLPCPVALGNSFSKQH